MKKLSIFLLLLGTLLYLSCNATQKTPAQDSTIPPFESYFLEGTLKIRETELSTVIKGKLIDSFDLSFEYLLETYPDIFMLKGGDEYRLSHEYYDTSYVKGRIKQIKYLRYNQYFKGVKVRSSGGHIRIENESKKSDFSVSISRQEFDPIPKISEAEMWDIVLDSLKMNRCGNSEKCQEARQGILKDDKDRVELIYDNKLWGGGLDKYYLQYKVVFVSDKYERWQVNIDANTGEIGKIVGPEINNCSF